MAELTEDRVPCAKDGCTRKGRAKCRGYCNRCYAIGLQDGSIERRMSRRKNFTHGSTTGRQMGCKCDPCAQARSASLKRSLDKKRAEVRDGTYTGPHGGACRKYGCQCPQAEIARKIDNEQHAQRRSAARASKATGEWSQKVRTVEGPVTVRHYPPRGVGLWTCGECGVQVPHRSPEGVDILLFAS